MSQRFPFACDPHLHFTEGNKDSQDSDLRFLCYLLLAGASRGNAKTAPKCVARTKISTATEMLETEFARADMILNDRIDGLMEQWRNGMSDMSRVTAR